jgi:hypothetical protein
MMTMEDRVLLPQAIALAALELEEVAVVAHASTVRNPATCPKIVLNQGKREGSAVEVAEAVPETEETLVLAVELPETTLTEASRVRLDGLQFSKPLQTWSLLHGEHLMILQCLHLLQHGAMSQLINLMQQVDGATAPLHRSMLT